jgi:succinate dehydrogenase / fumarate reductase cytochrome b subunit
LPYGLHVRRQLKSRKLVEESLLMSKARPKFLNLFQIRQPIPAIVSILHRISGAALFVFLWIFLVGLERSLVSAESYAGVKAAIGHPLAKLVLLGLVWAVLHHTFAGMRHLGLDLRLGIQLPAARWTAYSVLILSLALTLVIGVLLW